MLVMVVHYEYLISLNCTLRMVNIENFIFCLFHQNLKIKKRIYAPFVKKKKTKNGVHKYRAQKVKFFGTLLF